MSSRYKISSSKNHSNRHRHKRSAAGAGGEGGVEGGEGGGGGRKPIARRVCDVALVVDHLFFRDVGGSDVADALAQVFWIVKEADAVFQAKDFDGDGRSEQVGVSVAAVTVLAERDSDINILDADVDADATPEDFLKQFSRYNFSSYCLGLLFTNRVFDDLVLGLSWRGNPIPGGVGGICQTLARYKADGKGRCKTASGS